MGETFYSWEILSETVVLKKVDKSVLDYNETGVPIEIRKFWKAENLEQGASKKILLRYGGDSYQAHIQMENSFRMRTKLSWPRELTKKITVSAEYPCMRFENLGSDAYRLDFIYDSLIDQDNRQSEAEVFEIQGREQGAAEGREWHYYTTIHERNPKNRRAAIKIHGLICKICGFDFQETYGEVGQGYIEIHHLKPVSMLEKEVIVNPRTDLIPVCANCHRMIHRKKGYVFSPEELKEIIKNNRKAD